MASAEECREALQALSTRLTEMSPQDRASYFGNRSMSCHVTDLDVTFVTRFTDAGAEPVTEAKPDDPPADIRLTASSDDVISLSATPANIEMLKRIKVKLGAFLSAPATTLAAYPEKDQSVLGRYARAIAYYRMPKLDKALPIIDDMRSYGEHWLSAKCAGRVVDVPSSALAAV